MYQSEARYIIYKFRFEWDVNSKSTKSKDTLVNVASSLSFVREQVLKKGDKVPSFGHLTMLRFTNSRELRQADATATSSQRRHLKTEPSAMNNLLRLQLARIALCQSKHFEIS